MMFFRCQFSAWFLLLAITANAHAETPAQEFQIVLLGDTAHGESYQQSRAKKNEENILETRGYDYSLQRFSKFLAASNVNIANLETPLYAPASGEKAPFPDKDYIHWTRPEETLSALGRSHLKVFSLANNHTLDYGVAGLEHSVSELRNHNSEFFGAGKNAAEAAAPYLIDLPAGYSIRRVAVIGCFEYRKNYDEKYHFYATFEAGGANRFDLQQITSQIAALKHEEPATFVILYPHWGQNYRWASDEQKDLARQIMDQGCDLIVGHGSHMLQEVEKVNDRLVFQNLGNFMFNSNGRYAKESIHPYSFALRLSVMPKSERITLTAYPIVTNNLLTDFQPRFLSDSEFADLQAIVQNRAGFLPPAETGADEYGHYLKYTVPSAVTKVRQKN